MQNGHSLLQNNPAYQSPMVFDSDHHSVITYTDDIDEQIVLMISAGLEDREISERVYLSIQELRKRIHRLINGANIRNRTQLAVLYSRGLAGFADGERAQQNS